MAQQEKLFSEISQMWDIYEKCMPNVARAYNELPMEVYKDGVLSGKIKRLAASGFLMGTPNILWLTILKTKSFLF